MFFPVFALIRTLLWFGCRAHLFLAVGGGGGAGDFVEGAVELGEGLEADVVGDVRDAQVGLEEFLLGEVDAAAGDELGEGEAGGGFEEAAEV